MIVIEENFPLRDFNTFGLPARARIFAEASSTGDLITIVNLFRDNPLPKLILGGGSNLLFTNDFDGVVIYPNLLGIEIVQEEEDVVWIKAFAGENWDKFVSFCVSKTWGGIENLSLIPGNVGACPIQNIGAYGVEVKDTIHLVEALNIETGEIQTFSNEDCKFGYRDSIFKRTVKNQYIIVSVTFKLSKKLILKTDYKDVMALLSENSTVNLQNVRDAIIQIRRRKLPDPSVVGNAGSFFKNPVIDTSQFEKLQATHPGITSFSAGEGKQKIPAAWLIEKCGWKGKREGEVGTLENQSLVIVNFGEAKGIDIYNFAKKIQQSVLDSFGIELEMEVNIL